MIALLVMLGVLTPLLALALLILGLLFRRTRRQLRTLEREARHDPLTGLPNRRGLEAHWNAMQGGRALLLIDLVGFKAVNDSHGHVVGDALLRQVSARLAATVPPPGVLARWGGDEFVAVVPADARAAQQQMIAEAGARAYDLSDAGGPAEVRIGARMGVSTGDPGALPDLGLAIRSAARNLLDCKGRRSDGHESDSKTG